MKIYLSEIKERYPEIEILNYDDKYFFESFNHDSRVNIKNALFIPIIGDKFNGHDFILSAFENGCTSTLFQKDCNVESLETDSPVLVVENIERGLEKILNIVREKIHAPVISITGSTGKTTTREMLASILKSKGKVLTSERNYNTLWGNAYLLSQYDNHDYVVLEFGMDRKGEIASQCKAINPDMGILLNVGHVHAELLGGIENVYMTKKELADYLQKNGKPLVLNIDDDRLVRIVNDYPKDLLLTVGNKGADFEFSNIQVRENGTYFTLKYLGESFEVSLDVLGKGYVYNAVSAIALAFKLGLSIKESVKSIKVYAGFKGRFEIIKLSDTLTVVNDAYNANPTSMRMALETFNEIWGKQDIKKILILGDMKELGQESSNLHKEIGKFVSDMNVDDVYYLGDFFKDFNVGDHIGSLDVARALLRELKDSKEQTVVLLKASNSIGLYNILEEL